MAIMFSSLSVVDGALKLADPVITIGSSPSVEAGTAMDEGDAGSVRASEVSLDDPPAKGGPQLGSEAM
jgi:hypothetical protein